MQQKHKVAKNVSCKFLFMILKIRPDCVQLYKMVCLKRKIYQEDIATGKVQ